MSVSNTFQLLLETHSLTLPPYSLFSLPQELTSGTPLASMGVVTGTCFQEIRGKEESEVLVLFPTSIPASCFQSATAPLKLVISTNVSPSRIS